MGKYYVVEVSIKEVTPPDKHLDHAKASDRAVDEVVKVISRASTKTHSINKAIGFLELEAEEEDA